MKERGIFENYKSPECLEGRERDFGTDEAGGTYKDQIRQGWPY